MPVMTIAVLGGVCTGVVATASYIIYRLRQFRMQSSSPYSSIYESNYFLMSNCSSQDYIK